MVIDTAETLVLAALPDCDLGPADVAGLVEGARRLQFAAGTVITREGDDGFCYVIETGDVALKQNIHGVMHVLATAGSGDLVGEDAFVTTDKTQSVTAVALTDVTVFPLDNASLQLLVDSRPALRKCFAAQTEQALIERLVRATTTFEEVSSRELRGLIHTVERRTAEAGTAIIKQGEAATDAFVIVDGEVDVIDDRTQRTIATLGKGSLFGETVVLDHVARDATVRARVDTSLLVLPAEPLRTILQHNTAAKARMVDLLNSRDRPQRVAGIEVYPQRGAGGSAVVVLKSPAGHHYFRLSGDSLFLWERCDGTNTIRDLATSLFVERNHFAPQVVLDTIGHLRSAGYLQSNGLIPELRQAAPATSRVGAFLTASSRILTATVHYDRVDGIFAGVYRRIGRPLFSRPTAVFLALVSIAGMIVFAQTTPKAVALLWTPHGAASFFLTLLPGYLLLIVLHEAGHGLAVKAIGRRVQSIGVGWYWFGPIAFVDTSDAWAGTRSQRVLVSAAGPVANLVLAAIASAIACWAPAPFATVAAWQFALTAYIGVVENLNPLMEFDGYYILVDLLDRPNLRRQSLRWMGSEWRNMYRRPSLVRGHLIECSYALGAISYIILAAAQTMLFYHVVGQRQLARIVPAGTASVLAWILPVLFATAAAAALWAEIRKVNDAAGG